MTTQDSDIERNDEDENTGSETEDNKDTNDEEIEDEDGARDEDKQQESDKELAATKIQSAYRGHRIREQYKIKKALENESAVKIQKVYRGHFQRTKYLAQREAEIAAQPKVCVLHFEEGELQTTLALIKPHVQSRDADEIRKRIVKEGFTIVREKLLMVNMDSANRFCRALGGSELLASGPVRVFVLARVNAIQAWQDLIGPENPEDAKRESLTSLRAQFGINAVENAVYGSTVESAQRDIQFFFPNQAPFPAVSQVAAVDFVSLSVVPVLTEGLAQLCKQKPAEPVLWLANWLLSNNPNKPKVTEPES